MVKLFTMLVAAAVANGDIRPLLREQGFGPPLNGRETINYVGHIPEGSSDYRIYLYRGHFRPVPGGVDHGVNRLIVLLNGRRYVGSYSLAMPMNCTVRGTVAICGKDRIAFTRHGPPRTVLIDGEVQHLEYGEHLKRR